MKNIFRTTSLVGLMAFSLAFNVPSAEAQINTLAQTTTTAAVSATDTVIALTSVSGITAATATAPGYRMVIDAELMNVVSISSLNVTVSRPYGLNTTHASGATVYSGPANWFYSQPPARGSCTASSVYVTPWLDQTTGIAYRCSGSVWVREEAQIISKVTITGITPVAAASATAADAVLTVTGGVGGAQSATTSNGAAGGAVAVTGGLGGAGGTSSGTGGAGGALTYAGGAGGGTITGGTGGAISVTAGAGGAGSSAGGTGGALTLGSGAAGSGGTGTVGAVAIKSGATSVMTTSTAGATSLLSSGTNQSVTLTPSGSGAVLVTGGTDPTKVVKIDASGNTTAITETLAFGATSARTATFPDASITVSGATATDCGTSAGACSTSVISSTVKIVTGTAAASSGTPSTVAITGMPAFTATTSYKCFASNATTAANVFSPLTAGYVSTTAVTFTGPNTLTDTIRWMCIGF